MIKSYSPDCSDQEATIWTWYLLLRLDYRAFAVDFGELFILQPPPPLFIEAIKDGSVWDYYTMDFVGECEQVFLITSIHAQQFFVHFIRLLTAMANEDWSEKILRNIAGFLFMRSMQAGTKGKRQA
jgi:hypothetical protein